MQDSASLSHSNHPVTAALLLGASSLESLASGERHDAAPDEALNLGHMELLIHLTTDKGMFNLGVSVGAYPSNIFFALKIGLESPFLLHEMLAFSARHLAFVHPERSAFYLHQAVALQTRAVSLFNATSAAVEQSNCVAILLFSSILGHHLLADTLVKRDDSDLDAFIEQYIRCAEMARGYIISPVTRGLCSWNQYSNRPWC